MMFTEGLDEKAISWIKQGSDVSPQPRSPLVEKYPIDSVLNQSLIQKSNSFLSPKVLPPVKFHSGLLVQPSKFLFDSEEEEEESVASVPEAYFDGYSHTCEEGQSSSESGLFANPCNKHNSDEEINSHESSVPEDGRRLRVLARGNSKKNLKVEVRKDDFGGACAYQNPVSKCTIQTREQEQFPNSRGHHFDMFTNKNLNDLGTPSAPPIGREEGSLDLEDDSAINYESAEISSELRKEPPTIGQSSVRSTAVDGDLQVPSWQANLTHQSSSYSVSIQSAWQTFVAYDACFRLCLNAWARNCMEAPEFLRDECTALRNAFGIQNFLLQPRGLIETKASVDGAEVANNVKGRKMTGQLEVEVKRIRIIPRRQKLQSTMSYRSMYMQVGAEYVKHVSAVVKNHINTLKSNSYPIAYEGSFSCLLKLKSSTGDTATDSGYQVCLKPGTGDSHIFYSEGQGDTLFVEVQDINKATLGCCAVQISQLTDLNGEVTKWWPIYVEDNICMGKIQLSISISTSSDRTNNAKMLQGGPVVETIIYDMVLEAAMRAQQFQARHLEINGPWRWLLTEFSDYYGVSDAYAKLRYLSCIMNVATPTKECLELIYELLLPTTMACSGNTLTRQERSILLDCEEQIKKLLATIFENYKSLDELSPTGLIDTIGPIPELAAPALVPAVKIFTLLHDVLSQEAQTILIKYIQTAATRRCRRHMRETDEFMSRNCDGLIGDPLAISTAYHKMKMLCLNIRNEIQSDIKIHNQHILPSFVDLPNVVASVYSNHLCKRLREFLAACPPSNPSQHVAELLVATADFEGDLDSWSIRPTHGGLVSRDLFHDYILVWIQETRLYLLDLCKAEQVPISVASTDITSSPFVEKMYSEIIESLNEYEVVINRWPQYLLALESVVADVERAVMKSMEKIYGEVLMPLKDGLPKMLEKRVQKITGRQSISVYAVPNQLGTFLNTVKRILDVLHGRVEENIKSWAAYIKISDGTIVFGEQMNGITIMLRKKYKKYREAIVERLVENTQITKSTRLKRILEETKEAESEADMRERLQALCSQLTDSIHNLHAVFSTRLFVTICRDFWDCMGKIVLSFLESRKENRIWYRGSDYALRILDDMFASEMQKLLGNSLQEKDLDPPRSVIEARYILS